MKNRINHCCAEMEDFLKDKRVPLEYLPVTREFYLLLRPQTAIQLIKFCPWCGGKLPEELSDIYYDILKKEYAVEANEVFDNNFAYKIPKEFKSDEWWKKRKL